MNIDAMNQKRIARRLKTGSLINVSKQPDGGVWIDAELQPLEKSSYGYSDGRMVEYVGFGGMEWSRVKR